MDRILRLEGQRRRLRFCFAPAWTTLCLRNFEPWPPTDANVDAFVVHIRSASSLGKYLSHLRTMLRWIRAPLGALLDTGRVVRGAGKSGRVVRRQKIEHRQMKPGSWRTGVIRTSAAGLAIFGLSQNMFVSGTERSYNWGGPRRRWSVRRPATRRSSG